MTDKRRFTIAHSEGETSRQAHADLPKGTFERELGREGFAGAATQMYHAHPPTGWTDWDGPLRPRAFNLDRAQEPVGSPFDAVSVLRNDHVAYRMWRTEGAMDHLVRNSDGDELLFVHRGTGDLFCDYGHLAFEAGDYIVLPRGTMWRVACHGVAAFLMIEATGSSFGLPDKGLVGRHAIFDPAMLDTPKINSVFKLQQGEQEWRVRVKRRDAVSTITYPFNPLDAVGWHGDLTVLRLNVRDIRPLSSHRYHLPPSAHTTFVADHFVVCTFVPRPFETDPGALKVPFFHSNDDYDEVLFYHAGDFFSRDNIAPGMMTFHPAGFTHGPHPGALANMFDQPREGTDEIAVMLDVRDPLEVCSGAEGIELPDYAMSWTARSKEAAE